MKPNRSTKKQFEKDLKDGNSFERHVVTCLQDFTNKSFTMSEGKVYHDFVNEDKLTIGSTVIPKGSRFEVKFDKRSVTSGNFGFEMFYRENYSGILLKDEHDYWVHGVADDFYIFDSQELKDEVEKILGTKHGRFLALLGDGSSGAVIPKEIITEISIMRFKNNELCSD